MKINIKVNKIICQEDASDMNSDGVIGILDVILVVNIILLS